MIKSIGIEEIAKRDDVQGLGKLDTLILFYDPRLDEVVVNSDNDHCELFSLTAETYLDSNEATREVIQQSLEEVIGNSYKGVISVLDSAIKRREQLEDERKAKELNFILGQQAIGIFTDHIDTLKALRRVDESWRDPGSSTFYDYNVFMYGYIQGIRMERARRKKGECHSC